MTARAQNIGPRKAGTYDEAMARYSAFQRVEDVRVAARHLKDARGLLAHAPNARAAVARALKSAEGALRHAELAPYREARRARKHQRASRPATRLYLIVVVGDLEPEQRGPFRSERERIKAARAHRDTDDREKEDGLYRLDVYPGGRAHVSAFAGWETDPGVRAFTARDYMREVRTAEEVGP